MGDVQKEEPEYELDERGFIADMADLKRSYRWSLRQVAHRRSQLEQWIKETYGMSVDEMAASKDRDAYENWKTVNDHIWSELQGLKQMMSDLNFAIEWLHTGKQPGNKRGTERRSIYQRTKQVSPLIMQAYKNTYNTRSASTLTPDQRFQLEQALQLLSPQERRAYELTHGQGFTQEQAAGFLGITRGSVKTMIARAQKKVSGELQGNLFLWDSE